MRFVDEGFLLLARGSRTPHSLPVHRQRGDPLGTRVREELEVLSRARQPPGLEAARAAVRLAGSLAGLVRRRSQLRA